MMRCKACNRRMEPGEIKWVDMIGTFDLCGTCLVVVRDMNDSFRVKDDEIDYSYRVALKVGFEEVK